MYLNDSDLKAMVIFLILICIGLGVLLAIGLPALWDLIKPFIHEATR